MKVLPIMKEEAEAWCKYRHYARRRPIIKYAFGLYDGGELVGIVTYGPTPTPAVQQHICGNIWAEHVLELNRLCIDHNGKNAASRLVGASLRMLPKPKIIVSYADTGAGHVGYIYQATNFIYTGAVTAHDAEYMIGNKKVHARTLTARGITSPKKWAKENGVDVIEPKPKHRYVYFVGTKKQKMGMSDALTYPIYEAYPKGESTRYDMGDRVPTQGLLI